jgi:hypothetical protein
VRSSCSVDVKGYVVSSSQRRERFRSCSHTTDDLLLPSCSLPLLSPSFSRFFLSQRTRFHHAQHCTYTGNAQALCSSPFLSFPLNCQLRPKAPSLEQALTNIGIGISSGLAGGYTFCAPPSLSLSLSLQPLSFLRSFPSASSPLADPLSTHTGYGHHIANGECSSESLTRRVEPSVGSRTNGDEQR